jgi:hypothetical protein
MVGKGLEKDGTWYAGGLLSIGTHALLDRFARATPAANWAPGFFDGLAARSHIPRDEKRWTTNPQDAGVHHGATPTFRAMVDSPGYHRCSLSSPMLHVEADIIPKRLQKGSRRVAGHLC